MSGQGNRAPDHVRALDEAGYVFERNISSGGMGAVIQVRQMTTQRRYVAKHIRDADWGNAALIAAFETEALQCLTLRPLPHEMDAARLSMDELALGYHNINLAENFAARTYLILEFIDGAPLDKLIGGIGPFAPTQAVDLAIQICNGMIYCARKRPQFVHRDLKPGNVILTVEPFGRSRRLVAKIIDFGLAKSLGLATRLTGLGLPYDTPDFAPPEFVRGGQYDIRYDIFSFGRTLEHLVLGPPEIWHRQPRRMPEELQAIADICLSDSAAMRPANFESVHALLLRVEGQLVRHDLEFGDRLECADCGFVPGGGSRSCPICQGQLTTLSFELFNKRRRIVQSPRLREPPPVSPWPAAQPSPAAPPPPAALQSPPPRPRQPSPAPPRSSPRPPQYGSATPPPGAVLVPSLRAQVGCAPEAAAQLRRELELSDDFGSDTPLQWVDTQAFFIDRYAVRNAAYLEFVTATGARRPGHWASQGQPYPRQDADLPVTHVSLHDAAAFCRWRNGRLPTALEWEVAMRGTDQRLYPWGNQFDPALCSCPEGGGIVVPVTAYPNGASPHGLVQGAGNVWEWVEDYEPRWAAIMGGAYDDPAILEGIGFANVTRGGWNVIHQTIGFRPVLRLRGSAVVSRSIKGYAFVAVPAGSFRSGCPAEKRGEVLRIAERHNYRPDIVDGSPETTMQLDAFLIGKLAVSNGDYRRFVDETGHRQPTHWARGTPFPPDKARHPVVNVSAADAMAFCRWLDPDARLPDILQWEKAARGTDGRLYPWGDRFMPELVNGRESDRRGCVPVDALPGGASPYGALNMAGNVGEWVVDAAAVRGGSFRYSGRRYGLAFVSLEARMAQCDDDVGLRCAYDVLPSAPVGHR